MDPVTLEFYKGVAFTFGVVAAFIVVMAIRGFGKLSFSILCRILWKQSKGKGTK